MTAYSFQALLLIAMMLLIRQFRFSYLFSFITAVIYGFVLDGFIRLCVPLPNGTVWLRLVNYSTGMLLSAAGVSAMFHTYIAPEVYELFVKEVSAHFHVDINGFKTAYDCASCLLAVVLSLLFFGFGHFVGVRWGTAVCALLNGWLIGRFSALYEKHWTFYDSFGWRRLFEM